jgi:uncharacterized protein YndB with AHSA1/START domain
MPLPRMCSGRGRIPITSTGSTTTPSRCPQSRSIDLSVGGVWRQHMVIDATTAYFTGGVYREIVPDEKLVFSWGAVGGWPELDLDHLDDSPLVTLTLSQVGGRTEMTVHVEIPASLSEKGMPEGWFDHIQDGWRVTVDRLARALGSVAA